jgi:hypothetical protein
VVQQQVQHRQRAAAFFARENILPVSHGEWTFVGAIAGPGHPPGWWQDYRALLPPDLLDFYSLEAGASQVLEWAPWQLPAIVQTQGHARSEAEAEGVPAVLVDQAGDAAVARGKANRRRGAPRVHVVLGQDALHRRVGGQETERDQFLALAQACEDGRDAPQFTIQLLPPGVVLHPGISAGPASILLFAPRPAPASSTCPSSAAPVTSSTIQERSTASSRCSPVFSPWP